MKYALVILLLAGCQSAPPIEVYVNEIAISNPEAKCAGARYCSERTEYRGKPMCTIFRPTAGAEESKVGAAFRECLR